MSTTASEAAAKSRNPILHIALWVVQGLLAFAFIASGGMKVVTGQTALVDMGMAWAGRIPGWTIPAIGVLEVLGAIGLILPAALRIAPQLTSLAASGLVLTMIVAGLEHASAGEIGNVVPNAVLGCLALFVAIGRYKLAPITPRGQ